MRGGSWTAGRSFLLGDRKRFVWRASGIPCCSSSSSLVKSLLFWHPNTSSYSYRSRITSLQVTPNSKVWLLSPGGEKQPPGEGPAGPVCWSLASLSRAGEVQTLGVGSSPPGKLQKELCCHFGLLLLSLHTDMQSALSTYI